MPAPQPVLPPCHFCGKPLRGRSDKKFCDPGCKNQFNNLLKQQERQEINKIDLILKHNRRILKSCLGAHPNRKIACTALLQKGLHFEFYTHHYYNQHQDEYCFCYDYGYLVLEEGSVLVVRSRGANV